MKDRYYHLIYNYILNNRVLTILKVNKHQLYILQDIFNILNRNFNYFNHKNNKICLALYNLLKQENLI